MTQNDSNTKNILGGILGITAVIIILAFSLPRLIQPRSLPADSLVPLDDSVLNSLDTTELADEKLRQEILKLNDERQQIRTIRQQNYLNLVTSYGSLLTALVAVAGIAFTIWKTLDENLRQRNLDRLQRQKEQEQKEEEHLLRLHENFFTTVKDLGSEQESIRASAAVSLLSFLSSETFTLHEQVYLILLANLKIKHDEEINRLLVRTFEKAIRIQLAKASQAKKLLEINLAHSHLRQINLSDLNLSQTNLTRSSRDFPSQIDLGFSNLENANLVGSSLQRTRGFKVNLRKARLSNANLSEARLQGANLEQAILHSANLVAADFKFANLKGAQFQKAHLQSAHLNKTDLRGARFEQANLADTFFLELEPHPGDDVLNSILNARNWEKAHFNRKIRNRLKALAEERATRSNRV